MSDSERIAAVIENISEAWRTKQYDEIGAYVADDVVIAPPGSSNRVCGRAAYVQSYREYDAMAATIRLTAEPPLIDVMGDIAVAVCPFRVVYQLDDHV